MASIDQNGANRDVLVDCLRAFAIILVVIGHSIQYANGSRYLDNANFFGNTVFRYIYGFHMPLFMIISGYLFSIGIDKKTIKELIVNRIKTLLVPIFIWGIINFLISAILLHTIDSLSPLEVIKKLLGSCIYGLWFLWALFYCSLFVIINYKLIMNRLSIYIIFIILMFITPDWFGFSLYKYMFPYFIIPFLCKGKFNMRKWFSNNKTSSNILISIICLVIYFLIILFWKNDYYIYTSGLTLLKKNIIVQFSNDIIRYVAGLVGSVFVISVFHIIECVFPSMFTNNCFQQIGRNSLGIYIISGLFFSYIIPRLTTSLQFSYLNVLISSVIVLVLSMIISMSLSRNKFANILLFGARK